MASIVQYVRVMRNAQWDICRKLDVDMSQADKQSRAIAISNLAITALLVKLLVAKGVTTDAELMGAINQLRNDPFMIPKEPPEPIAWDTTPVTGF